MRLFLLATALAMTPASASAQPVTDIEWQLLAIDGVVMADMGVTLKIDASGALAGRAPCNSYGSRNVATLPELKLSGLRSTRMACDRLKEERIFFDALMAMTRLDRAGDRNLILTGPDGRSMEFVLDRTDSLTDCRTCSPKD
jgi:heat shock protein HslJ